MMKLYSILVYNLFSTSSRSSMYRPLTIECTLHYPPSARHWASSVCCLGKLSLRYNSPRTRGPDREQTESYIQFYLAYLSQVSYHEIGTINLINFAEQSVIYRQRLRNNVSILKMTTRPNVESIQDMPPKGGFPEVAGINSSDNVQWLLFFI